MENKDDVQRKIRKYRNTLYTLGNGMIALGLWSIVQIILMILNSPEMFFPADMETQADSPVIMGITVVFVIMIIALIFGIFGFAGSGARAEGLGKKRSPLYIVATVLLLFVHIVSVVFYLFSLFSDTITESSLINIIVTITVNVTVAVVMAELVHAAVTIRKYERNAVKEK